MSEPVGTPDGGERIVAERMEKLHALREQGVEPFAYGYDPTHSAADARALFEAWEGQGMEGDGPAERVRVAGRVVAKRVMGKSTFIHLADRTGRIQLYLRVNDLAATYPLRPRCGCGTFPAASWWSASRSARSTRTARRP